MFGVEFPNDVSVPFDFLQSSALITARTGAANIPVKPLSVLERTCYASKEQRKGIRIYMSRKKPGINRFSQMIRFFRVSRLLLWTNPAIPHLV